MTMTTSDTSSRRWGPHRATPPVRALAGALALALLPAAPGLSAQEVTFTRDVAPIFYENCVECHRPSSFAPMSLVEYETARRYAARIRSRVEQRLMPPWHVDQSVGIQRFENEMSLTDEEIATVVAWVDQGAPEGDADDLPPLPDLPQGDAWELEERFGRPPDLIVRSTPYDVIANGQDQWWGPSVPFDGLPEERWIEAYEFKPAFPLGLNVVHHGHATLRSPEGSVAFAHYGVGKRWETFPESVGMRWPDGPGEIEWNLHYFPVGTPVPDDVVEVGLWFFPEGEEPEIETRGEVLLRVDRMGGMPRGGDILIPPGGQQVLQGVHVIDEPTLVNSFRPHMHMRGKEMSMEAIYPDGRRQILSKVGNYKHNWQISYQFAPDAKPLLPPGTVLLFTSVFDNSAANPLNPDPEQWVVFGRRGVDEMSHAWVGITELEREDFDRLVEERQQRLVSEQDDDQ